MEVSNTGLGLEARPRDLILMVSVLADHVSVLVSEVPALSTGSREPASASRPASRPNLDGLGLGHPCLGLGRSWPRLQPCCTHLMPMDMTIPLTTKVEGVVYNVEHSKAMSTSFGSLFSWKVNVANCRKVPFGNSLLGNLNIEVAGNPPIVNHSRTSSSEILHRFSEVISPLIAFNLA